MKELVFIEKQKFHQIWIWGILIISLLASLITTKGNLGILLASILPMVFLYILSLNVKISKSGIHYQFFPLHRKVYSIKLDEIDRFEEITYSPIRDYGGWGIRYSFKGKAYNVSGNKGVKIYLKNSKKSILFGSQRSNEFASVLDNLMRQ